MAVTTELITLHRIAGDRDRIDLDASELDDLTPLPAASTAEASEILMPDDTPLDPTLRTGADDEGAGGYHR